MIRNTYWLILFFFLGNLQNVAAREDGLYAKIETTSGLITAELYFKGAPYTVMNFVGLAEGTFAHGRKSNKKYYDGLVFHRVIPGFVVQGGDPTGTGRGGPGYKFPDEINPALRHDSIGILSMANAGPGTNGSQFFITLAETKWLNRKHTVFGKVIDGLDVLTLISQGDQIQKITIERVGQQAEEFQVDQKKFNEWAGLESPY